MNIPEGITVRVQGRTIFVQGPNGALERTLPSDVQVVVDGNSIEFRAEAKKVTRVIKARLGAIQAHVRNMIEGAQKNYMKKLQLVYSHFPVTVEVKGSEILIKNFLGEKTPRKAQVKGKATVAVKGQEITVSGPDKDDVGQTASNMIRATKILRRDERVFQDGIYYA